MVLLLLLLLLLAVAFIVEFEAAVVTLLEESEVALVVKFDDTVELEVAFVVEFPIVAVVVLSVELNSLLVMPVWTLDVKLLAWTCLLLCTLRLYSDTKSDWPLLSER